MDVEEGYVVYNGVREGYWYHVMWQSNSNKQMSHSTLYDSFN
jgi:hypothetical protein